MGERGRKFNMNHISYIFINEYKCLHQVDFSFDVRYSIRYSPDERKLSIKKNNSLPDDFWGVGVYGVSCIIGNNGSGKSTALCFLLDALVKGANLDVIDGIIVYESENALYVYLPLSFGDVQIESHEKLSITHDSKLKKADIFYYSAHFLPYSNINDLRACQLKGYYNASDMNRIVKDLEDYSNIHSLQLTNSLYMHLEAYTAQNNHRICSMLADIQIRSKFKSFDLPKYLLIGINQGGSLAWNYSMKQRPHLPPVKRIDFSSGKQKLLFMFFYYNIINVLYDTDYFGNDNHILEEWQDYVDGTKDVIKEFENFATSKQDKERQALLSIYNAIKALSDLASFDSDKVVFYFDVTKDADKIRNLSINCNAGLFLTSRYFNYYYCRSLKSSTETILSSGEQELLDLFSRIYDAVFLNPLMDKEFRRPSILLLDEAEMGYHPEWQRRYINVLVDFLNAILVKSGSKRLFQVIVASHSPILLSDMPKQCCNYLFKEGELIKNVRDEQKNSLASNIFDLYRDSFFLNQGLIGEFAMEKLKYIQDNISDLKNNDIDKLIAIIGDERIKRYLLDLREKERTREMTEDEMIRYYQNRIEELRCRTHE